MKHFIIIILTAIGLIASSQAQVKFEPEISEKKRVVAATAKLKAAPGTVLLFAKGLCCESCAIGIRKKVQKLKFVDTTRFNKGVELDAKTQLVTIAMKKGATLDMKALDKAIKDAGYDAMKLYELTSAKQLKTSSF